MRTTMVLVFLVTSGAMMAFGQGVHVDNDDIGGVVESKRGPEAGVWVIAETSELPTRYVKIVVTDDEGRYLMPDLPTGELRPVGPGIRPCRFAQSSSDTRQDAEPHGRPGAQPARGGAVLPRRVLVLNAPCPRGE